MPDLVLFYNNDELVLGMTHERPSVRVYDIIIINPIFNFSTNTKYGYLFWYIEGRNLLNCDDINYDDEWAMFVPSLDFHNVYGSSLPAQVRPSPVDVNFPPSVVTVKDNRKCFASPMVVRNFRSFVSEEKMKLTHG